MTDVEQLAEQRAQAVMAQTVDGAAVLDDVQRFLTRFIAYPSEAASVAHTLWIGHCWFMERWESTPRLAFLSPEPGSGKSRALEVTEPLVPRPIHAVNTTPAYLFRKVSDKTGLPTILYDEIDTVFGAKAKDNEEVRGMLNAGHRRGAVAGRCVVHGKRVVTEELPAYCPVALAGLNDLPDTLRTRSVVIRMRRRGPAEHVEPWRQRINVKEGLQIGERLQAWATAYSAEMGWPDMPNGIEDRNADVWEALLAVADLAGDEWPERARATAVTLVTALADGTQTLGVQLLSDLRDVFGNADKLTTTYLLEKLHQVEESPWSDLRGKPLDARGLANRLSQYGAKSITIRTDGKVSKGYRREALHDAWTRYLPSPNGQCKDESNGGNDGDDEAAGDTDPRTFQTSVTSVTAVTARSEHRGSVTAEGEFVTAASGCNGTDPLQPDLMLHTADLADQAAECLACGSGIASNRTLCDFCQDQLAGPVRLPSDARRSTA